MNWGSLLYRSDEPVPYWYPVRNPTCTESIPELELMLGTVLKLVLGLVLVKGLVLGCPYRVGPQ